MFKSTPPNVTVRTVLAALVLSVLSAGLFAQNSDVRSDIESWAENLSAISTESGIATNFSALFDRLRAIVTGMQPSLTATLEIPTTMEGFDNITIAVSGADADASYQVSADIGGGVVLDLPHRRLPDGRLEFTSPPGVFEASGGNTFLRRGNVKVGVKYKGGGRERDLDAGQYEVPGLPPTPDMWPPGTATLLLLQAIERLPEDTFTNLGIANTNADNGLDFTQTNTLSRRMYAFIRQLDAVTALVQAALAGDTITLSELSSSIVAEFSIASIEKLDEWSFQLLQGATDINERVGRSSVAGNPEAVKSESDGVGILETESRPEDILATFDIEDIANQLSTSFANDSDKFGQIAEVTSALVTSTTTVSGSSVASSEELGAIAFFIPTMLGATLATVVNDNSKAILEGKSQLEVTQASAQDFSAQYLDPIADDLASADVAEVVGKVVGDLTSEGIASYQRLDEFVQESALPAYGAGELPLAGIPESPFEITRVSPDRRPPGLPFNYSITVFIAPAPDPSQKFVIEIASLDDSVSDQSAEFEAMGSGFIQSEWSISPPGQYRLSVFAVGGRAASSRVVSFF